MKSQYEKLLNETNQLHFLHELIVLIINSYTYYL